jgi:hypothetical protein
VERKEMGNVKRTLKHTVKNYLKKKKKKIKKIKKSCGVVVVCKKK